jgi:hypothetical protein
MTTYAHVTTWRHTRPGQRQRPVSELVDAHVRVDLGAASDPSTVWAERADVLCVGAPQPAERAAASVDRLLSRFPGCLVALVPDTAGSCVAGARDGTRVVAAPVADARADADAGAPRGVTRRERAALASFLHGLLVLGRQWGEPGCVILINSGCEIRKPLRLRVQPLRHVEEQKKGDRR